MQSDIILWSKEYLGQNQLSGAYSEPCQTSKKERFAKIVNS